jgi:uncharacterized membrane protein (DUF2068 family)
MLATNLKRKMPLGVKIIALLNLIIGFAFLAVGIEFLFSKFLTLLLTCLLISIPSLIVGFSFYKAKKWGWIFAVISYSIGVIATIISAILGFTNSNGVTGVAISIIILAYLNMSHVKEYFGKDTISREA